MRATGKRPRGLAWLALSGAAVCAPACVDLFHSTDFGTVDCPDDAASSCSAPGTDAQGRNDATRDAPMSAHDGGGRDGGRGDAPANDSSVDGPVPRDASKDATLESGGGPDANPGTDFCTFSAGEAAAYARHACTWLAACAGNDDLNEYGVCYTNARLAYDCALNPNQRVRGPLHAYWDALRMAESCASVMGAIFPSGVPSCNGSAGSCANELFDGGNPAVVAACDAGTVVAAVNCDMRGYTCFGGACVNGGSACPATTGCAGKILYSCQTVENEAGTTEVVDVGRNCTNFGGGECVSSGATGAFGCAPNDASIACTPSAAVSCTLTDGGAVVTGCATGALETVNCGDFVVGTTCDPTGVWAASSRDLVGGCYNAGVLGSSAGPGKCLATNGFNDNAGPSGVVTVDCIDAGFAPCTLNVATSEPYCPMK